MALLFVAGLITAFGFALAGNKRVAIFTFVLSIIVLALGIADYIHRAMAY